MRAIAFPAAVILFVALPGGAHADGQSAPAADGPKTVAADGVKAPDGTVGAAAIDPKDSPLVRASKAARAASAARPKPIKPIKVITNDEVRKSKGKLSVLPPRPGMEQTASSGSDAAPPAMTTPEMREKQLQERERRDRLSQQIADSKRTIAALESALNRLEDEYYQSDDPSYRDNVIQKRFSETKSRLERSREALRKSESALAGEGSQPPPGQPLATGARAEAGNPHEHS
jgi:hypothetical protein